MTRLTFAVALAFSLLGCGGGGGGGGTVVIDEPYESCQAGDECDQGTVCSATTLPVSAGFTGNLCTVGCNFDTDCPQDLQNFSSICVNSQCYTQCPDGGANCPYGTGCVTLQDQDGNQFNLCTP
jgi:hypothetical protein